MSLLQTWLYLALLAIAIVHGVHSWVTVDDFSPIYNTFCYYEIQSVREKLPGQHQFDFPVSCEHYGKYLPQQGLNH